MPRKCAGLNLAMSFNIVLQSKDFLQKNTEKLVLGKFRHQLEKKIEFYQLLTNRGASKICYIMLNFFGIHRIIEWFRLEETFKII